MAGLSMKLTITDAMKNQVDAEEDKCVSATDSAFGVEEIVRVDFISELPYEVAVQIFVFVEDLFMFVVIPCVSKRWRAVASDNEIWRTLFLRRWKRLASNAVHPPPDAMPLTLTTPSLSAPPAFTSTTAAPATNPENPNSSSLFSKLKLFSSSSPSSATDLVASSSADPMQIDHPSFPSSHNKTNDRDWKLLYRQRLIIHRNWRSGSCTTETFSGHSDAVYCIQFDPHRIVSGSRDRSLKFWSMDGLRCLRTLKGHDGSVLCLQYDGRRVVTGSSDSNIIVWDFITGEKLLKLTGHAAPVLDVRFSGDWIVSCSKDCTIKIWHLETGQLLRTLEGHHAAVNAVHLHGGLIASASGDCLVKLWSAATGAFVRDFVGHTRGLACVQFDGETVVSGSNDQTIKVWNAHTGECLKTLYGHTQLVRTLCFDEERIVSGSYDQTVKVWDIKTGEMLHSFEGVHSSWVFHVQMDAYRIVSASQDRKIAVWDFSKGCDMPKEFL